MDSGKAKIKIHAFNGRTGAGKTTISTRFAKEIGAFRISHDELLSVAYDQEQLAKEHSKCCERANNLAWRIIERVTTLGIDVVLEGWGTRDLRDQIRKKAEELNLDLEFYFVSCPQEERLKRIRRRNERVDEDAPYISHEDFFRIEAIDEEIGEDEIFTVIENNEDQQSVPKSSPTNPC